MTIEEVISIVDKRTVNSYTNEDKVKWLCDLENIIYNDLVLTHENPDNIEQPTYDVEDMGEELIVPAPYAEDVYVNHLQRRIAKENGETAKYNIATTLFNEGYINYAKHYNTTYRPIPFDSYFKF